jgi:tetratricopeptide (TPR) repeat protein
MKKYLQLAIVLPLLMVCTKKETGEGIVRIGKSIITKNQMDAFEKVTRMYPTDPGNYFPGMRSKITYLIDAEAIYRQKAVARLRDSLEKTADWEWKKLYFPAQMFLMDFLSTNLNIPEEKINNFYETHKDSLFKITIKGDSVKADSTYYRPIAEVKSQIVDSLFLKENKPDSAFLARYDTLPAQADLDQQWMFYIHESTAAFFMKRLYKELTGSPYPDSVADVFGEGKFITQRDMDVILSWIPEARREMYKAPERQKELVEWLVKWKVFSAISEKSGRSNLPEVKMVMKWASKLNTVFRYVSAVMVPAAQTSVSVDSSMLLYALFDDNGYLPTDFSSQSFANKMESEVRERITMKIDSTIISFRNRFPVTFLQNDWKDTKNDTPSVLLKKADVLRDSGKTNEARDAYLNLTKNFVFTPEGQTALVELAKLQTEQQLYSQAINNYRKYLLLSNDSSKRCNTFFMIGFIYDEYLDKPLQAEYNYKWVLKNAPECELADDAEFMMLHLDEPMSSVEELRDEAQRQGRKIDPIDDEMPSTDTMQTSMTGSVN